nr:hypothetical protein BaRGS_031076 [Batillaria attramentaria]
MRNVYLENNVQCLAHRETVTMAPGPANEDLLKFSGWYAAYHGYVSLCVCVSGIVTNTFNVTVLTRRKMRTPVNQILTGLALSDIITMLSYVPFAIHFYCMHPTTDSTPAKNTYGWMFFLLFHINLTTVTHTISIWLCVVLAIVRYLHIRSPTRASTMRNKINQRRDFLKFSISNNSKLREHSRTTKMLITVIVLFIITELPQGILIVLSATKEGFFNTVYLPLGDIMDIVALVNNAINFVLYCSMSTKFRETFLCLYCHCRAYREELEMEADGDGEENGYVLRDKMDSCCSNNN